jgi:excisionase family DNA binding protein
MPDPAGPPDVLLYKVPDVMHALNLSRSVVFELLRTGRLRSVKEGRSRLIPASAVRDYVALLEQEADAA